MSTNQIYIPEELTMAFYEIPKKRSDYHSVYKQWWNRTVDVIRKDNYATETKRLFSALAENKLLMDDLEDQIRDKIRLLREKVEAFSKLIQEPDEQSPPSELVSIWEASTSLAESISNSLEHLQPHQPEEAQEQFTSEEMLYHRIKHIEEAFKQCKVLYAKYLGLSKCRRFYWDHDQICYLEDAETDISLVSWGGIQNFSIKEMLQMGHRQDHATYIRFMYYMQEENNTSAEAYVKIQKDLERLSNQVEVTYILPESHRSLYKTAKKHVGNLLKT